MIKLLISLLVLSTSLLANERCQIIFDAGSSGTRLYAFKKIDNEIKEIYNTKINIGVSWAIEKKQCGSDICTNQNITDTVESLITKFISDNQDNCSNGISSVKFLATAGMRLAEQKSSSKKVSEIYNSISAKIFSTFKNQNIFLEKENIKTKTLSGTEEGIFTWLTVNNLKKTKRTLGIFEIGGASAQIAYECTDKNCKKNTFKIKHKGKDIQVYSYSWLGLGRKEANRIFNIENQNVCSHTDEFPFSFNKCLNSIDNAFLRKKKNLYLKDPLNYKSSKVKKTGTKEKLMIPANMKFHGVGSLGYVKLENLQTNADEICHVTEKDLIENKEDYPTIKNLPNFLVASQCFANLYFKSLIEKIPNLDIVDNALEVNETSVGWILGAAICSEENCLDESRLKCRWKKDLKCSSK